MSAIVAPELPLEFTDAPAIPGYLVSMAFHDARKGAPARLKAIIVEEKRLLSSMAILGNIENTAASSCLLQLFRDAAVERNIVNFKILVNAEAHEVARVTGFRPLHYSAVEAFVPGIRLLLKLGCDANAEDDWGNTPLRFLLSRQEPRPSAVQQHAALKILLGAGANPNLADKDQTTPLHLAVDTASPAIVQELIRAGANVNVLNKHQDTPLTRLLQANSRGQRALVFQKLRVLLAAGATVNPQGTHRTPLQLALKLGSIPVLQTLVARGAK